MEKVLLECKKGLGSKLLDTIGFFIFCKCLGLKPAINLHSEITKSAWGFNMYDENLFVFSGFELVNTSNDHNVILSPDSSVSFCPYKVYEYIKPYKNDITFEDVSYFFEALAKEIIKPAPIIESHYPEGIENAYGIHLRFTDKVKSKFDFRHECGIQEFIHFRNKMLEDIRVIIKAEETPTFLFVSEDKGWRKDFIEMVNKICKEENKEIKILEPLYDQSHVGFDSVLDLFCLSKCKEILQSLKYSAFSVLASLLGNKKIRNYSKKDDKNYDKILFNAWNSVIEVNNEKVYDEERHKKVCSNIQSMIVKL